MAQPLNLTPEQEARQLIDTMLLDAGWVIQNKNETNIHAAPGIAIREYQTDVGPADYVLFVDAKPAGIVEAKRAEEGVNLTMVEEQSQEYAGSKLKYLNNERLPFVYESTGEVTRFTSNRDPRPRARNVFGFHRPETFRKWLKEDEPLRERLGHLAPLITTGLRDCQITAINNLEGSFRQARPRALVQMATGSGKTFTAITAIYRLLKHARAGRVLFLVDTKNLGEQAEQEFMTYTPADDNRRFTELYGVHRLRSSFIPDNNQVYISTIQRMYSVLKGEELDESAEESNPAESRWQPKEPVPVAYNPKVPIEFFDFIVIDECHRSIYNLWSQVLTYFDAFLIGLTATPDNRTFGFFQQNIVSDYGFERAVTDGVLVGYDTFLIETKITKEGGLLPISEQIEKRERTTRKKFWEQLDEDVEYSARQLDNDVVNESQIRLIIRTIRDALPKLFPDRYPDMGSTPSGETNPYEAGFEVPKTLIFAKSDSHADDIINMVRNEFAERNDFCKKITYRSEEDPKGVLARFRNAYYPRIVVTVDMIATGTDVRPLECLLFMRDVKSRNYFEQMKGRGTRTMTLDDLRKVTPTAKQVKDHFVIVDAIGVTKSLKTDSRPLERKPGVPLKDLLGAVAVGVQDEDLYTSLANRLIRLGKQMNEAEHKTFAEKSGGRSIAQLAGDLLNAYNPDNLETIKAKIHSQDFDSHSGPLERVVEKAVFEHRQHVAKPFTGELNTFIEHVRKVHSQILDSLNLDELVAAEWAADQGEKANQVIQDFKVWIEIHKDEITALQIFYSQPYRRRELTFPMVKELLQKLKEDRPTLAPLQVWRAYEQTGSKPAGSLKEAVALVSLIRHLSGVDKELMPYGQTVDRAFMQWILRKNAGKHNRFSEEQMAWLRMMKEHIASSFHLEKDDLEYAPFDAKGGLGKAWQLFGAETESIIEELNEALAA